MFFQSWAGLGRTALVGVQAVVLETDGSFTVIGSSEGSSATALAGVQGIQDAEGKRK